ncbi:MAG: 30S ribosomal protein S6e [Nanoarchaeota archaeon]|nr:30S ribosomal protein S6e [Nanoarchaeota archaeon]
MAEHKLNIGDSKSKKTYKKVTEDISSLYGKKLGETINGELIDLNGYELEITGGSDASGFPMRKDVDGTARKRILIVGGVGMRNQKRKGLKLRKMVAGNTIYEKTSQINLKVTKWGKDPIEKPAEPEGEAAPAEEAKAEE